VAGGISPGRGQLPKSLQKAPEASDAKPPPAPPDTVGGPGGAQNNGVTEDLTAVNLYTVQRTVVFLVPAASVAEPDAEVLAQIRSAKVRPSSHHFSGRIMFSPEHCFVHLFALVDMSCTIMLCVPSATKEGVIHFSAVAVPVLTPLKHRCGLLRSKL
jgi:hypothetical protein